MSGPRSAAQLPYELRRRKQLLDRSHRYLRGRTLGAATISAAHLSIPANPARLYGCISRF